MPNDKFVHISASGNALSVDFADVHISKSNADQVIWKSSVQGKTVTITFADGPFSQSIFTVDTTGATPSGPAHKEGHFKYTLSAPGFPVLDPNVIVDR